MTENNEDAFEAIEGFFPEHPDPVVSDSAAILLISACETRNVRLVRYALSLSTALGCPDEVLTNIALHGAMRLRSMDTDDVHVAPWHFHRVQVEETGERLWTFEVEGEALKILYRTAQARGFDLGDDAVPPAIAEAQRTGRTICTAANDPLTAACSGRDGDEHEHDQHETRTLIDALQAHWPVDEEPQRRWVGIARMAMCAAELAHFGWGNPAGFQPGQTPEE